MSQGISARSDPTATSASSRLKFLFSCCFTASYDRDLDALPFIANEYDFIVEKLLVKRVPLGLFAIPRDINEGRKDDVFLGNEPHAAVSSSNQRHFHSGAIGNQSLSGNTKTAKTYASPTNTNQNTSRGSRNTGTLEGDGVCGSFPKFVECTGVKTREEQLLESLLTLNSESVKFPKARKNPDFLTTRSCFQELQKDATPSLNSKFVVAPVRVEYKGINEQNLWNRLNYKSTEFEKFCKHARQDGGSYLQDIQESAKHSVGRTFLIAPKLNILGDKLSSVRNSKTTTQCSKLNTCENAHQPSDELQLSAMTGNGYADPCLKILENFEDRTALEPILTWKITIRHCTP